MRRTAVSIPAPRSFDGAGHSDRRCGGLTRTHADRVVRARPSFPGRPPSTSSHRRPSTPSPRSPPIRRSPCATRRSRRPRARKGPLAYGQLVKYLTPDEVSDSYALPSLRNPGVLRDTAKLWSSARSEPVHQASANGPLQSGASTTFRARRECVRLRIEGGVVGSLAET